MKTTLWLVPLVVGLASCAPYSDPYYGGQGYPPAPPPEPYPPAPGPYPPSPPPPTPYPGIAQPSGELYRATGTEPFWSLEIGRDLVFTDQGSGRSVREPAPRPEPTSNGERYRTPRIDVTINRIRCNDGMSDRTYPDTVQVYVDGRLYRGCGAPAAFYSQVDERGVYRGPGANPYPPAPPPGARPPMPPQGPAPTLDRTRWRVAMINGQPTPRDGDYSIQFEEGRMSAKFGCNTLNAGYEQRGSMLDPGMIMATRMACSNMRFENQGSDILGQDLTIRMLDPNRIMLENGRGSIALERR